MQTGLHEDLRRHAEIRTSSDRSFGLWFAVIFGIIGLWPLKAGGPVRTWALAASAVFLLAGILWPAVLSPLNRIWTKFGLLLARIMNPVVTGLMFFLVVTPTALVFRIMRKDLLRLRKDAAADSYWLVRQPPGPEPDSMSRQF